MKLKTKLVPLTGLALLGTACIPFWLTSCSKGWDGKGFDVTVPFYPSIKKLDIKKINLHECLDIYTQQLKRKPETFIQDYLWSKSVGGGAFEQFYFWSQVMDPRPEPEPIDADKILLGVANDSYSKSIETISHLSISTQDLTINEELWTIPTLSFTLSFESNVSQTIIQTIYEYMYPDEPWVSGELNGRVSGNLTFYHVPFQIRSRNIKYFGYDFLSPFKSFEPYIDWMQNKIPNVDKPSYWRIQTSVQSVIIGEVVYKTGLVQRVADSWMFNRLADSNSPSWSYSTFLSLEDTICNMFTTSYFLQNITIEEKQ